MDQIVLADLEGHPDTPDLDYHEALCRPAASRYAAVSPHLLRWFKLYNQNRPYRDQVKPFNFLNSFQACALPLSQEPEEFADTFERMRKKSGIKPIAPFSKDIAKASRNAFDRETGEPVSSEELKTYGQALAQYHLSPEPKFHNGDYTDRGLTRRRHIQLTAINHIGKEANKWEEQYFLGSDEDAQIDYGEVGGSKRSVDMLKETSRICGERKTAVGLNISRGTLRRALLMGLTSLGLPLQRRIEKNYPTGCTR